MIHFEKIPQDVLIRLEDVKKLFNDDTNVIFAYLFGGLAKGTVTPLSDIDIALYCRHYDAEYVMNVFVKLCDVCKTSEIDLVILNTAPVALAGRIVSQKIVIVDKEPFIRHSFESLTLRKYFDFSIKEKLILYRRYGIGKYSTDFKKNT
ncbi:MAG: nucleotidyltransferase domain-containing protein [Spirochaetota bacterium]